MKRAWVVVMVAQILGVGACKWEDVVAAGCEAVKYGDGRTGDVGEVLEETCGFVDSYVSPLEGPVVEDHIDVFMDDPELDGEYGDYDEYSDDGDESFDEDEADELHEADEVYEAHPEHGA